MPKIKAGSGRDESSKGWILACEQALLGEGREGGGKKESFSPPHPSSSLRACSQARWILARTLHVTASFHIHSIHSSPPLHPLVDGDEQLVSPNPDPISDQNM